MLGTYMDEPFVGVRRSRNIWEVRFNLEASPPPESWRCFQLLCYKESTWLINRAGGLIGGGRSDGDQQISR